MYAIIVNGQIKQYCDKPLYVKLNESGTYIEAEKDEAEAISILGTLYNLEGKTTIKDAPEALIAEADLAEIVGNSEKQIAANKTAADTSISSLEDALCEQDESQEKRIAAIEDALCELDSSKEGE